ncbi:MAG TPA: hypothetical protein VGG30_02685 [Pirellulales bacterium]|jgi:hypothetical protein
MLEAYHDNRHSDTGLNETEGSTDFPSGTRDVNQFAERRAKMLAEKPPQWAWRFGPESRRTADDIDARCMAARGRDPGIGYNADAHLVRTGFSFLFPALSISAEADEVETPAR